MKRITQNVKTSAIAKKEFAEAYASLAADGPYDADIGICFNVSQLVNRDGYKMTKALFRCVTGVRGEDYPLRQYPSAYSWAVRRKWCAAFAESFSTGEIRVDSEMQQSLVSGVRK
ncbi:hypothetical protein D3C84_103940 [compost metagenome]